MSVAVSIGDIELETSFGYPLGYAVKPMEEQLSLLRQHLGLSFQGDLASITKDRFFYPIEGPFFVPKWQAVGGTYEKAFSRVLDAIGRQRSFVNNCPYSMGLNHLRLTRRAVDYHEMLARRSGDSHILVVPAQFGQYHAGHSASEANRVMPFREFPLDPYLAAVMLLTHPERFKNEDDLRVDCPGCEYDYPDGSGPWSEVLCFLKFGDQLCLSHRYKDDPLGCFGSASGFIV